MCAGGRGRWRRSSVTNPRVLCRGHAGGASCRALRPVLQLPFLSVAREEGTGHGGQGQEAGLRPGDAGRLQCGDRHGGENGRPTRESDAREGPPGGAGRGYVWARGRGPSGAAALHPPRPRGQRWPTCTPDSCWTNGACSLRTCAHRMKRGISHLFWGRKSKLSYT